MNDNLDKLFNKLAELLNYGRKNNVALDNQAK